MFNRKIREEAKTNRVKLWQVAEKMGIPDFAFSKMLRRELPEDVQNEIIGIIHGIAKEAQNAEANSES